MVGPICEERTYRRGSYHNDIGERCDCVSSSVLTLPDPSLQVYIQKTMMKYWIPETQVTSADDI